MTWAMTLGDAIADVAVPRRPLSRQRSEQQLRRHRVIRRHPIVPGPLNKAAISPMAR